MEHFHHLYLPLVLGMKVMQSETDRNVCGDRRCSVPNGLRRSIGRRDVPAVANVRKCVKQTRNVECSEIVCNIKVVRVRVYCHIAAASQHDVIRWMSVRFFFFFSHLCQTPVDVSYGEGSESKNIVHDTVPRQALTRLAGMTVLPHTLDQSVTRVVTRFI
jgi:hypothetical protein